MRTIFEAVAVHMKGRGYWQRGIHDRFDLQGPDASPAARPRGVSEQVSDACLHIPLAPQQDRWPGETQLGRQKVVGVPRRRPEHNPGAKGHFCAVLPPRTKASSRARSTREQAWRWLVSTSWRQHRTVLYRYY